jgi:hypothetical protein
MNEFESVFEFESNKVVESIAASLVSNLGMLDSFAAGSITIANITNQTWPFVTLPDFAIHAAKLRALSDGLYVSLQPVVNNEQRLPWEKYARENSGWVNESRLLQESDEYYYQNVSFDDSNLTRTIVDLDGTLSYDLE